MRKRRDKGKKGGGQYNHIYTLESTLVKVDFFFKVRLLSCLYFLKKFL